MARFKLMKAAEYGTAAVVEYRSGEAPDGAAIILFVAPDRNWAFSHFGVVVEPSVGTSDAEARAGYERATGRYVAAVRTRDCATLRRILFVSDHSGDLTCEALLAGTAATATRLRRNPGAEPEYLGGNRTFGFFALETRRPEPENLTIAVMRADDDGVGRYLVMDVVPSPTAAQVREVVREYRRQRDRARESMAPGADQSGRKAK